MASKVPPSLGYLSVVMPAYNEASRLATTVPRVLDYLRRHFERCELIVVDDGSCDETGALLASLARPELRVVSHPHNRGKGAATKTGILSSHGDWVLLTDADLSTPIEELAHLRAHSHTATVIVGSRALDGARVCPRQPLGRELLGKSYNVLLRLLRLTKLRDTQCGFKLIRGDRARRAARRLKTAGFAFDVELLWLCAENDTRIVEVGVRWGHAPPSSVRIPGAALRMLWDTLRLRRRLSNASAPRQSPH